MSWAYEYVVGFVWTGKEGEQAPDHTANTDKDDDDSLDEAEAAGSAPSKNSSLEALDKPSLVIRKSTTAGFKSTHSFKAVPSMIIKEPEPQDNYDASVIAVILAPIGAILVAFGFTSTLLAYVPAITGIPYEDSVAVSHYGFPVKIGGPALLILGALMLLLALVVLLCTPHQRHVPMLYLQPEEEGEELDVPPQVRAVSAKRVSIAPLPAGSAKLAETQERILGATLV